MREALDELVGKLGNSVTRSIFPVEVGVLPCGGVERRQVFLLIGGLDLPIVPGECYKATPVNTLTSYAWRNSQSFVAALM